MQYQNHKKAKNVLDEIQKYPEKYLIIHYSCESFIDIVDGHTPRITSIAVRSIHTSQTDSFSIHKTAEKKHFKISEIEEESDALEKDMLEEFYKFVESNSNSYWLHWNMRDINYGFQAIEHRYEVLGGKPIQIPIQNKIDLNQLLINLYGVNYISHPRMVKLIELNSISTKDFLTGEEEAKAYESKDYIKLHQSTLRKVDIFSNILNRVLNKTLKVNSNWKDIYGVSIQGCYEAMVSQWWGQFLILILGGFIGHIVSSLFS